MSFKDHFSRQATAYAKFRPQYPRALFAFIAAQSPDHKLAVDCATGNGQAAIALAEFFQKVIALDASAAQIETAQPNDRVEYRVAPAETTGLPAGSCAALTVAQALHWFDLEAFYAEARRVLERGGVLAVWAYNDLRISPELEAILRHFHDDVVGPYWPPERRMVGNEYLKLAFPFAEIAAPHFEIEVRWDLGQLLGYLGTWSATQRFRAENDGRDPVERIRDQLEQAWGDAHQKRPAVWPLTVRTGRSG
jgi:SAM-dependent methyltransferase